jgi:predicted glycosyltransferase
MLDLAKTQLIYEYRVLKRAKTVDPDVMVSVGSPAVGHAAKILGKPHVLFTDNDVLSNYLATPFADIICTPEKYETDYGSKHIRYPGYHELAYLHPEQFTPEPDMLRDYSIEPTDDYFILRFVSWGAHHDVGKSGLDIKGKRRLVSFLEEYGAVYITSEGDIPSEFEEYQFPVPPHLIHNMLSYANIYIGDSQTMATEAAVLGTPSVRANSFAGENDMSNFVELEEQYELLYSFEDQNLAIEKIKSMVNYNDLGTKWEERRKRLISDKINVGDFITEIIVNAYNL